MVNEFDQKVGKYKKTIEECLEKAKKVIQPWEREKEAFSMEYQYRDYEQMEIHSNNLLKILKEFTQVYIRTGPKRGPDFRSLPNIRNLTVKLYKLQKELKENVESLNLQGFVKNVDKIDKNIRKIIDKTENLIGKDPLAIIKDPRYQRMKKIDQLMEMLEKFS